MTAAVSAFIADVLVEMLFDFYHSIDFCVLLSNECSERIHAVALGRKQRAHGNRSLSDQNWRRTQSSGQGLFFFLRLAAQWLPFCPHINSLHSFGLILIHISFCHPFCAPFYPIFCPPILSTERHAQYVTRGFKIEQHIL